MGSINEAQAMAHHGGSQFCIVQLFPSRSPVSAPFRAFSPACFKHMSPCFVHVAETLERTNANTILTCHGSWWPAGTTHLQLKIIQLGELPQQGEGHRPPDIHPAVCPIICDAP